MEKRNLEIIYFHLYPKGKIEEKIDMSNIDGVDFIDTAFTEFVSFIDNYPTDEKNKQVVKVPKKKKDKPYFKRKKNYRAITGILETGKYGTNQNVYQKDDVNGKPVYKITKDQSVHKPFFFLVCISNLKKNGLIILERDGPYGINGVFSKVWKEFVKSKLEKTSIHYSPFIDNQIVNKFVKKGALSEIKFTRNYLPQDIADRYSLDKFEKENYVLELSLKTIKGNFILGNSRKKVIKLFENELNGFFSSDELKAVGFDDKAKLKVVSTYKNQKRVIDLSDTMKFKPYYEVKTELNKNGHSKYKSIEKEAIDLLDSFSLDLY